MSHHSAAFDISVKTHQQLIDLYGIEIDDDGSVYDPYSHTSYSTLGEWAADIDTEVDQGSTFEKIHGKHTYTDD